MSDGLGFREDILDSICARHPPTRDPDEVMRLAKKRQATRRMLSATLALTCIGVIALIIQTISGSSGHQATLATTANSSPSQSAPGTASLTVRGVTFSYPNSWKPGELVCGLPQADTLVVYPPGTTASSGCTGKRTGEVHAELLVWDIAGADYKGASRFATQRTLIDGRPVMQGDGRLENDQQVHIVLIPGNDVAIFLLDVSPDNREAVLASLSIEAPSQ